MGTLTNFFIFMKTKILKFSSLIAIVILALCMLMSYSSVAVFAAMDETTVLDELQSDPDFDITAYEDKADDFSLQVIQIGEDEAKELYIYTFQPAHRSITLVGSSVSISYGFSKDGKDLEPKMYELELISSAEGFDKYHVKGITEVTGSDKNGERYYNIVAIYREFNDIIDTSIDYGETDEIGYSVGQQWLVYDINNSVAYEMGTFETLEVKINLIDHAQFDNGFTWDNFLVSKIDKGFAWYAAFDLENYKALHIYDADISFRVRTVEEMTVSIAPTEYTYGEWELKEIHLIDSDVMSYQGSGLLAREYSWNRILSSDEFIKTVENNKATFTGGELDKVKDSQWVFTFYETQYVDSYGASSHYKSYSEVEEFAILTLHFMDTNYNVYDLGVVSDKVTPDDIAGIDGGLKDLEDIANDFAEIMQQIFMIIGIIVLVVLIVALVSLIAPLGTLFKKIFNGICYVISLPFQALAWVFKKDGRK